MQQPKDKNSKMYEEDSQALINPLTSVELNSSLNNKRQAAANRRQTTDDRN